MACAAFPWLWALSRGLHSATLGIHSHIITASDSGITVCPRSCWGGQRDAIALKPRKADVPPVGNYRSSLIVAVTLHFQKVVSAVNSEPGAHFTHLPVGRGFSAIP